MAANARALAKAILRAQSAPSPAATAAAAQMGTFGGPALPAGGSPLVASSYGDWTSGRVQPALPRDYSTFLAGMFGPLAPMIPMPIDQAPDGSPRAEPRVRQYPVSWNMPHGVPGDEGLKLASFGQLRTIAETYSVAQACIRTRSQEILGIDWDIVPTKEAEKKMRGDEKARREFDERRAPVKKFFNKPDPNYFNFGSWLTAVLDDVFVVDALSMYLHPSRRPGKGIAGSDLAALDVIDGTTIRPYMDLRGAKPSAPNPAYAQYLYGVPRVDLMTMLSGQDVKDLGEGKARDYRGDHLLYLPYVTRSWTPYGFPPVERALVPIMSALQRQQYQAAYFSDGSVPSVFVSVGNVDASPAQCRQLQDALNAMAGDPAWKHRIIVIPGGAKIEPMRPNPLADAFDDLVMTQVCMAFDIQPMELGITPRTSTTTSGGAQNQMAKASENINQRKALKPLLKWLKDIFDAILHNVLGYTDMAWHWEGMEEGEDEAQTVETLIAEVKGGLISVDEARVIRGHQPWGMDITGEPVYMTATDVIPLAAIDRKTGKPVGAAPPPGAGGALGGPPPGGPSGGGAPKKPGGGPSGGGGQPVLTPAHAAAQAHADALAKIPEPEVPAHEDYDEVGERVERDRRKAAAAVQVAKARLAIGAGPVVAKVGPKGYEHGWKKVHPISAATIAGYTDAQRDAMRFYSSWEYNNINRQLRQGTTYGRVTEVVDTIRSAMTPTSHDTVTYRRASGRDFGLDEYPTLEQLQAQAGKTFTQPAFMSTTLDEGRLAGHPAVVHMQVDVPAGTMAASLHDAGLDHDHELLLDVGQRYELVSVEPMGAHEFRAHVRVLPADNAGTILTDDEQDTADELTRAGATVHPDGTVTAYHYTTPENAAEIRRTGRMRGAEDGLFFTTKPGEGESQGGSGRGGAVVEFRLPLGAVQIDDLFDDEAHLRIPLRRQGDSADVSGYIHKAEIRLDGRAIHNSLLRFTQPEPAAPPVDVPGALRELDLIRRRLNKGRTIDDWTVQHLPDDVFDRLQVDYPQGVDRAVDNARTAVKNIGRRQTRDQVTGPLEHAIAGGLGALVDQVAAGELSTLGFVDDAVEVLRVCIREALALGVQHARGGATLGKAVTGAPTGNPIDPRLRLYAGTAPAAYEVGYGLATIGDADDPDNIAVRWHPLPDACALCAPREGQLFTVGTLPGWPGEGGFGPDAAVCEGGPNCRCSLSYEMIPTLARLAGVGQDAPPATSNPLVARWRDAVRTGPDAVERTIDEVAGERAEAQRPFLMRLLKDLLSTLARAFGRRGTTKSADGGGDGLAGEVFEYLNRHYPAKVLGWVHDADWTDPTKVPLVDIDMARRPGGRDPAKVKAIAELVRHGERLDPVVLVRTPGQDRLQIADGYHRTLGREHAGKKRVLAYVGEVDVDEGPWDRAMHDAKLNKAATVTKTGDGHGHHIPGTPMVYSHGWKKVVPDAAGGTALADREPGRVSHSAALDAAREWAGEIHEQVQEYVDVDPDDYDTRNEISRNLYNSAGIHLDNIDDEYTEDDDLQIDMATIARAVASHGDWTRWIPCREIRQSAYKLLGFEGYNAGDLNIEHHETSWGGEGKPATPAEWATRDLHAYLLLAGIRDTPREPYLTLWRGVDLHGRALPAEFREGAVLEMPLTAFGDDRDAVGQYGTDVTFMLPDARAVKGGMITFDEEDEEASAFEYVSGGHLRIVSIRKLDPPETPSDLPEYPDEDDYDGDPDGYDQALEAYDLARERYYDLETDELLPEYQPWTNDRYVIELEQVGVYDPDSGEVVKGRGRRRVPSYDWMFADPMRPNPDVVKAAKRVCEAAGLAVVAADTGRVLMLQRAHDPDDDAGGMWEFPGGRLEPGEDPLTAARREWAEETGCTVPKGQHRGGWTSGVYQGFVWQVPDETCVPIHGDRDAVTNPDDPDRDQLEAIAWWDPDHLTADNPAVRAELAAAIGQVKRALAARAVKCLTCGCDQPHNEHGDPRNITWEELVDAAEAAGISPEEAWANAEHAIGHEQRIDKRRGHDGWRHQLRDREGPDAGQWIDMPDVGGVDLNPFGAAGTPVSPVDVDAPLFPWPHPTSTAPLPTPPKVGKHGPTRDQIRAALASGEHHREALTGGQIAATQRVTFNNGTVLVHKTYIGRERPRAEYLTSLVGDAVGAPVPAVVLDPDNESALWMGFIDNADPAAAYHITTPMQEVYQTPEALRLGLLDVLTFNVDRHRGNWLIRDDDQTPAGIDHGEAFIHGSWRAVDTDGTEVPLFDLSDGAEIENAGPFVQMFVGLGQQPALRVPDRTDLRGYRFRLLTDEQHAARPPGDLNVWHLSRWIPNPLTADEAAQVRVGLEGLQAEFRAQRRGYWWDDMMARLDQIERHAVGVDQQDRVGSLA